MPSLTTTPLIKQTASDVLKNSKNLKPEDKKEFLTIKDSEGVPLSVLQSLLSYSKELSSFPKHLHQLLKDSKPYHYIPPPKPRDPELEKRCQKLRAEMENRQYRKMVKNIIEPHDITRIKDSMELQAFSSQMSVGINIIVTMFSCFVVGWYLGTSFFSDSVLGICTGIVCLIIGMLVDMWIFVINGSTLDKHLEKQKKRQKNNSKLLPNYSGLVKYD